MAGSILVSNLEEMYDALKNATGGETILLEGGNYGAFYLNLQNGFDLSFPSTVTIRSMDMDNPASFSRLSLHGVENLTLDGVVFDYTFKEGDLDRTRPFEVNNSSNVSIVNSVFDGDLAFQGVADPDGFGSGIGLSVRDGSNILIEGNEFFDWHRGLVVNNVEQVTVRGNDIHDIRSDGMNFVEVQQVLIEDNYIHDFKAIYSSIDHRDMIQFWTNGTDTPSTDIIIRNNKLDIGEGSYTQSIFMRNEAVDSQGGGEAMYYQNVVIENNVITNGHLHGITVGETNGLTIQNNSVLAVADTHNPDQNDSTLWVPSIRVSGASKDVTITHNATATIIGEKGQTDWNVQMNAFVQNSDPFAPGYYEDVFISSTLSGEAVNDFKAIPDGMLGSIGAGASDTLARPVAADVEALYAVSKSDAGNDTRIFDATLTQQMLEEAGIEGGDYRWTFGDGSTATGLVVEHNFKFGGNYDIVLEVWDLNGTAYTANSTVDILGPKVVSFDGAQGAFNAYQYGDERQLSALDNIEDGAIQLGGSGSAATVWRGALDALRGSDTLSLDLSLTGSGGGEVFRMHGSFISYVNSDGEFVLHMFSQDGGDAYVATKGIVVNDGAPHVISIQLESGVLSLSVDGQEAAKTEFLGTLPNQGSWDLTFGNPWGKPNFEGSISAFDIAVGPIYPDEERVALEAVMPVEEQPVELAPPSETVEEVPETVEEAPETVEEAPAISNAWQLDIASLAGSKGTLKDDAMVIEADGTSHIVLDGYKDYVQLGRMKEFESYNKIGFSIDFSTDAGLEDSARLVWNHMKLGLSVQDGQIMVQAATADQDFKAFYAAADNLGDGATHNATVLLDTEADRLQVIVDDDILIDINDVDFDLAGAGGRDWGWTIGTAWNRFYEGEVSNFQLGDDFEFQEADIQPLSQDIGV